MWVENRAVIYCFLWAGLGGIALFLLIFTPSAYSDHGGGSTADFILGKAEAEGGSPAEFAYSGDLGPGFWGELSEEWLACSTDSRQSPIDIAEPTVDASLTALELDIRPTRIHLMNNGHTVEQEYEEGSTLIFNGTIYELLQFHFHTLSEHTVNGKRADMELHAVFRHNATGSLAVLALLFELGRESEFLAGFANLLPAQKNSEFEDETEVNLREGLTGTSAYYTYNGSLTTPPCSPIVAWIVLKEAAEMSKEQFDAFRRILGNNFRPLQEINDRTIWETP
jgi:carbonic anhydrase